MFIADGPKCYWQMSGIGLGFWKSSTHIHTYILVVHTGQNGFWKKCLGQTPWICWLQWHPICGTRTGGQPDGLLKWHSVLCVLCQVYTAISVLLPYIGYISSILPWCQIAWLSQLCGNCHFVTMQCASTVFPPIKSIVLGVEILSIHVTPRVVLHFIWCEFWSDSSWI